MVKQPGPSHGVIDRRHLLDPLQFGHGSLRNEQRPLERANDRLLLWIIAAAAPVWT